VSEELAALAKDIADRMHTLLFKYIYRFAYRVCSDLGDVSLCDRVNISLVESFTDKYGEEAGAFIGAYSKYENEIGIAYDIPEDLALSGAVCHGIAHELRHAKDAETMGKERYDGRYIEYSMRYGYIRNPFEVRAEEFGSRYVGTRLCRAVTYLYLAFTRFLMGCKSYDEGDIENFITFMTVSMESLKEFSGLKYIDREDRHTVRELIRDIEKLVSELTS